MPSKEEMCILSASNSVSTSQDFLARDMEELVSEIKENLRLSATNSLKSRSSFTQHRSRASPYRVPSRDSACDSCAKVGLKACSKHGVKKADHAATIDDPYEMLQELLRDGSLIKEAVRRLQRGLSPKQRYFYDSEDDSRSPIRLCHLEL